MSIFIDLSGTRQIATVITLELVCEIEIMLLYRRFKCGASISYNNETAISKIDSMNSLINND